MTRILRLGLGFLVAGGLPGCYSATAFQSENADLFVKPHPIYKFYGIFGTGFDLTDPEGHSISFSNAPPGEMLITLVIRSSDVEKLMDAGRDVVEITVYDSTGQSIETSWIPLGEIGWMSTGLVPKPSWDAEPKGRVHIGWEQTDWLFDLAAHDEWMREYDEFPNIYPLGVLESGRPQRTVKFRLYEDATELGEILVYPVIRKGYEATPIG